MPPGDEDTPEATVLSQEIKTEKPKHFLTDI